MELKDTIGYITEAEGQLLAKFAAGIKEGVIVNVGTFQGKSTFYLAKTASQPVYTIDMFEYELYENYEKALGLEGRIEKIVSPTQELTWYSPIGLIFIDGGHNWDSIQADYELFGPHIIPGGVLIFHDYSRKHSGDRGNVPEYIDSIELDLGEKYNVIANLERMLCLRRK